MGNVTVEEVNKAIENSNKPNLPLAIEAREKLIAWSKNPECLPDELCRMNIANAVSFFP